jgi:hypothetical protein
LFSRTVSQAVLWNPNQNRNFLASGIGTGTGTITC